MAMTISQRFSACTHLTVESCCNLLDALVFIYMLIMQVILYAMYIPNAQIKSNVWLGSAADMILT